MAAHEPTPLLAASQAPPADASSKLVISSADSREAVGLSLLTTNAVAGALLLLWPSPAGAATRTSGVLQEGLLASSESGTDDEAGPATVAGATAEGGERTWQVGAGVSYWVVGAGSYCYTTPAIVLQSALSTNEQWPSAAAGVCVRIVQFRYVIMVTV